MKVGIGLGDTSAGTPASMDLEELLATRLLVQGNSGSGKSHLLRRILEQSARWVQQVVIDPEGDFVTLDVYGHVTVDAGAYTEGALYKVAARVRQHRVSAVLNLEGLDLDVQMRQAAAFLRGLFDADRAYWYPMLVVVDEAQLFAPAVAGEVSEEARRASLGAMTDLMCRGRKRGMAGIVATQRLAKLAKNVAAEASNFLMGRTFLDIDMMRAADLLGMERRQAEAFRDLPRGNFIALGPAVSRRPLPVSVGPVETGARSTSPKLLPLPDMTEAPHELILAQEPGIPIPVARPQRAAPSASAHELLAQLARSQPLEPGEEDAMLSPADDPVAGDPEEVMAGILAEMMADADAAFRPVAVLYQDFVTRCRMKRLRGIAPTMPEFQRRLAVARAGIGAEDAERPEWEQAASVAATLPEDLQGVYLLLARAALDRRACPGDAEIARACGSHSPGRARRLLSHMDQRGYLVLHHGLAGLRSIALPALGWQTSAGDPNAAFEVQDLAS